MNGTKSQPRREQVQRVAESFISTFVGSTEHGFDQEAFLAVYHPDIAWYDHAFHIRRVGHQAVLGLRKGFMHCNQPFAVRTKAIIHTAEGAVVEHVWVGRCSNDIVRPDGEVAVKASGKDFQCHVCMVLKIDDDGQVTRIDEYYNKAWDVGVPEEQYKVLKN